MQLQSTIISTSILLEFLSLSAGSAFSDGDWVTLLEQDKKGEWNEVGKANWEMKDGVLVADKLDGNGYAYLVSKSTYKDFQVYAEFWVDDDANSGIFIRCEKPEAIDGRSCYEFNVFDKRPDPSCGTGAIVDTAKVDPMPKAGGKWNTYEITAQGSHLVAVLNGQRTTECRIPNTQLLVRSRYSTAQAL
ncbi:3-keto-disaccharide hydrolase [Bradyrhizobium sp. CCBAU 45389]|uniref:3-keto-disaccharide hydrolase n=1 Tax=Bradyrhizobium sp. CCBAU 45389 TaxID=858429 RepID=UPI002FE34328